MFAEKQLVKHSEAGAQLVHGCKIQRTNYDWVVSYKGQFIAQRDTYCEAEVAAEQHSSAARTAEVDEPRAGCAAARHMGASVRGFDSNGNVEVW